MPYFIRQGLLLPYWGGIAGLIRQNYHRIVTGPESKLCVKYFRVLRLWGTTPMKRKSGTSSKPKGRVHINSSTHEMSMCSTIS
jgi:hypothetical protein